MPYFKADTFRIDYYGENVSHDDNGNFSWQRTWLIHTGPVRMTGGQGYVGVDNMSIADTAVYTAISYQMAGKCNSVPIPWVSKSLSGVGGGFSATYIIGARVPGSSFVVSGYNAVCEGGTTVRLTLNYKRVLPVNAFASVYIEAEGVLTRYESLMAYNLGTSPPTLAPAVVRYKGTDQIASVPNVAGTIHQVTITGLTAATPAMICNIAGTLNNVQFDIYPAGYLLCNKATFQAIPGVYVTANGVTPLQQVIWQARLECTTASTSTGLSTGEADTRIAYTKPEDGLVPADAVEYSIHPPLGNGGIRVMGLAPYGTWDVFLA